MTKTNHFIAYGLTQEEALAAQLSLANTMNCAPEIIIRPSSSRVMEQTNLKPRSRSPTTARC